MVIHPNSIVSHYRILEKIGEGGMGIVYKAEDLKLKRFAALKFLHPHLTLDIEACHRFVVEAQSASALDHPNICTIYGIDQTDDGRMFISMAFYHGLNLRESLGNGPLSIKDAIEIVIQIAKGLERGHGAGIVHRDINPANIIVTDTGEVKIIDFGLAKLDDQTGQIRGTSRATIDYMSPEQIQKRNIDHRTDIWSLGVLLYEATTGRRPFPGEFDQEVMYRIVEESPQPIISSHQPIPDDIIHVIRKTLQKNPERRYQNSAEMRRDLESVLGLLDGKPSSKSRKPNRFQTIAKTTTVLLVIALLAGFFLVNMESSRDSDSPGTRMVAVLPFSYYGTDQYSYLGSGIAEILSRKLDGAGDIRTVESSSFLRSTEVDCLKIDLTTARTYAKRFGASLLVRGSILEADGRIVINASMNETSGGLRTSAELIVESEEQLLGRLDKLVIDLLTTLDNKPVNRLEKVAGMTTASLPALKKYLEGESHYRRRSNLAMQAFREAVQLDSTFALAWYRLTRMASWNFHYKKTRETMHQALKYVKKLPEREQWVLQASNAHLLGAADQSEKLYRRAIFHYPRDIEALRGLGMVLFHYNMMRGGSVTEGRKYFEQILEIEPSHWESQIALLNIALMEGRSAEFDSLIAVLYAGERISQTWRSCQALFRNDVIAWREIIEELKTEGSNRVGFAARYSTMVWFDWASYLYENALDPREIIEILISAERGKDWRGYGLELSAHFEAGTGRWSAARKRFEQFSELDPLSALESQALSATSPFVKPSHEELRKIRNKILRLDIEAVEASMDPNFVFAVHNNIHPQLQYYLLGLISARLGEEKDVEEYAKRLEKMETPNDAGSLVHDLTLHLRAELAVLRGDETQALLLLERTKKQIWFEYIWVSHVYSLIHSRFLRAELLRRAGRYEEALGWYVQETGFPEMLYTAPSFLRSAEIYQELGHFDKAIEYYKRFIRLWKNCDQKLQPMVENARAQLAILEVSSSNVLRIE